MKPSASPAPFLPTLEGRMTERGSRWARSDGGDRFARRSTSLTKQPTPPPALKDTGCGRKAPATAAPRRVLRPAPPRPLCPSNQTRRPRAASANERPLPADGVGPTRRRVRPKLPELQRVERTCRADCTHHTHAHGVRLPGRGDRTVSGAVSRIDKLGARSGCEQINPPKR